MSIAVSVRIAKFTARNNFGAARQKSAPQSATAYSFGLTVERGSQLSAPAPVARGRWSARKSATAYIYVRQTVQKLPNLLMS